MEVTMKFRNLLLIVLFGTPLAFGQLFTRVAELPLPAPENAGFGNMVAGVDFDGDGKMEVYLPNNNWLDAGQELIPTIYKYEYDGALGFSLVWQATLAPDVVVQNTWPALTWGDLDKDGRMEIIWGRVNYSGSPSNDPRVIVYEYAGDGSDNLGVADGANWKPNAKWAIDTAAAQNIRPFKWVVADPDGDGTNELVFSTRNGTNIFNVASVSNIPDNGDGSETWTLEYAGGGAPTYNDLIVLNNYAYVIPANAAGNTIGFKYDAGAWTALPVQVGPVPGGSWNSACVVDIDNNGTKEVVIAANGSSNRNIYLLQQSGDTLTATAISDFGPLAGTGGRLYGGSAGDIDLNGKLDFAFGTRDALPDNAQIYRLEYMGGDITLPASYTQTVIDKGYVPPTFGPGRWMHIAIANVDGDPRAEVLYGEGTGEMAPIIVLDSEGQIPVELKSFAASVVDGFAQLNWSTATETNNRGFEVQRKVNGSDYTAISFVQGKGTTTETQNYSFVDNSVQSGTYSYRLKQYDMDGSYTYSQVVEVSLNPTEYNLAQNYPNPFNPSTTISFSLAKESNVSLRIFDLLGQEIVTLVNNEFMQAGSYSYKFDASSLASGTYVYRLEAGAFVQTKKMTLSK
jgi:hypothetical protein